MKPFIFRHSKFKVTFINVETSRSPLREIENTELKEKVKEKIVSLSEFVQGFWEWREEMWTTKETIVKLVNRHR